MLNKNIDEDEWLATDTKNKYVNMITLEDEPFRGNIYIFSRKGIIHKTEYNDFLETVLGKEYISLPKDWFIHNEGPISKI